LNVHGVNDVRQTEVPEPSDIDFEMANEKLKRQNSQSFDQISAELIKSEIEQLSLKLISLFILSGIRMNCLKGGMSRSLYLSILWVIKQIAVTIEAYHLVKYVQNFSSILLSTLIPDAEEIIGDHQCELQYSGTTIGHIFCIHHILEKKWKYNEAVQKHFIDLKKAYD
jgi:hypothetical protein